MSAIHIKFPALTLKAGRRALREENAAVSRGDIDPFGPEAGNLETLL